MAVTWDEGAGCFWIDCGHRRVAAARAAGLEQIPAVVSLDGDANAGKQMTEKQLVENLQRTQLPPLDVAHALARLREAGRSVADIGRAVGKSRSWVHKHLKILELPAGAREG